jgi:PAS domain S-box-containing protein
LLRRRAEDALRGKPVELDGLPLADIQSLLHELQVHQAELSIPNEELRSVHQELEASRDLYSDLYHFAPAGYCTLSHNDRIREANQTLAILLGVKREALIHNSLSQFVERGDQDAYYLHRRRAFEDHQSRVCTIHIMKQTGEKIDVRLESRVAHVDGCRLWVMLSDITEQQRIEKVAREAAAQSEQERHQLSHDLHDGPVQELLVITFRLHEMLKDHPTNEIAHQLAAQQIDLLRAYATGLRPPILSSLGLEKALRSHADIFQGKHPDIRIQLELHQTGPLLPEPTALALFRIYQEALINILKHIQNPARQVLVRMEKNEHLVRLEIQSNGSIWYARGI